MAPAKPMSSDIFEEASVPLLAVTPTWNLLGRMDLAALGCLKASRSRCLSHSQRATATHTMRA
ncbi:hypothetical protein EJO68_35065 [Variovorax atrisoli]|nr:hypothetical protein EJO68_35065 [Variovorax sp. 369]